MIFEQFKVPGLAHFSYAVGCMEEGIVAIIDPERNIDVYMNFARVHELNIAYILETHIHADYASGARELAEKTGAQVFLSAYDKGEKYEALFPHQDIYEDDALSLGKVLLKAIHTPGHTPEHLAFLVFDLNKSASLPMMMLTGDFLLIGSLGRPDLLGEEAKPGLAKQLFKSVRKLDSLPDGLEIYPAHGAGSLCGSGMSSRNSSTLGYEKATNPYLQSSLQEEEFVHKILSSLPLFPEYYKKMKELNSRGAETPWKFSRIQALPLSQFLKLQEEYVVVDLRDQLSYGTAHIPDSFGLGSGPLLSVWASWVLPYDKDILFLASSPDQIEEAAKALVRVGLDRICGYLQGGMETWYRKGLPLSRIPQLSPKEAWQMQEKGELQILDVRASQEWAEEHIENSISIQGGELEEEKGKLDKKQGYALICKTGYVSTVSTSLLERAGFEKIYHLPGGMKTWKEANMPLVKER